MSTTSGAVVLATGMLLVTALLPVAFKAAEAHFAARAKQGVGGMKAEPRKSLGVMLGLSAAFYIFVLLGLMPKDSVAAVCAIFAVLVVKAASLLPFLRVALAPAKSGGARFLRSYKWVPLSYFFDLLVLFFLLGAVA